MTKRSFNGISGEFIGQEDGPRKRRKPVKCRGCGSETTFPTGKHDARRRAVMCKHCFATRTNNPDAKAGE